MKSGTSIIAFALVACAGTPPTEHLATSMAAVKTAESAGASQEPKASLHLKLAQAEVEQAQQLIDEEEYEHADRMTLRARDDAELALQLTREAQLKRELQSFAAAHPELETTGAPAGGAAPAANPTSTGAPNVQPAATGR